MSWRLQAIKASLLIQRQKAERHTSKGEGVKGLEVTHFEPPGTKDGAEARSVVGWLLARPEGLAWGPGDPPRAC